MLPSQTQTEQEVYLYIASSDLQTASLNLSKLSHIQPSLSARSLETEGWVLGNSVCAMAVQKIASVESWKWTTPQTSPQGLLVFILPPYWKTRGPWGQGWLLPSLFRPVIPCPRIRRRKYGDQEGSRFRFCLFSSFRKCHLLLWQFWLRGFGELLLGQCV